MGQMRVRRTGPWVKISCPFSWVQFNIPLGSAFGSGKSGTLKTELMKSKSHRNQTISMAFGKLLHSGYFLLTLLLCHPCTFYLCAIGYFTVYREAL
jgi:hypothetical protein